MCVLMIVEILTTASQTLATGINDHEDWKFSLVQTHLMSEVSLIRFIASLGRGWETEKRS